MKALLVSILAVAALAGAGALYAVTRPAAVAPVQVTSADAASADRKAASLQAAAELARRSGRPVQVSEVFSDAELTALASQQLASSGQPVDSVALHSSSAGYVEGTAQARVAGQDLPVYFRGRLTTVTGHPQIQISDTRVGVVGVPAAVADQLAASFRGGVDLGSFNVQNVQVAYGDGSVTLSGTVLPG